jgi:hypothetical protein
MVAVGVGCIQIVDHTLMFQPSCEAAKPTQALMATLCGDAKADHGSNMQPIAIPICSLPRQAPSAFPTDEAQMELKRVTATRAGLAPFRPRLPKCPRPEESIPEQPVSTFAMHRLYSASMGSVVGVRSALVHSHSAD